MYFIPLYVNITSRSKNHILFKQVAKPDAMRMKSSPNALDALIFVSQNAGIIYQKNFVRSLTRTSCKIQSIKTY